MNTPISVFIICLNEEAHIGAAIDAVSEVDEVVVVDSGSSDNTVAIATAKGARVIHQQWLGFAEQKSFALSQCRNEWCLNLDADEVMPPELLAEIRELIDHDRCDLIRLPIEDVFMGAPMHRMSRKRAITRGFKRSIVRYPTNRRVHENVLGEGRLITTQHHLVHYGYNDLETFMDKFSRYARLGAEDKFQQGRRASILKLVLIFPFTFLKVYFLRKLCLSGVRGLIQSTIEAIYAFLKEAHLYQLGRTTEAPTKSE